MLEHYTAGHLALGTARREMTSARPDAPVVAPRPDGRLITLRVHAAASLHRLAVALEPAQRPDRRLVEPAA